jgi:hypothetical protein
LDTNIGDSLTVRAEVAVADAQSRLAVANAQALGVSSQSIPWVPRALLGFTWTNAQQLSIMAEYYYNGAGFIGDEYSQLLQYAQNRRNTGAPVADLIDQFGTFTAARNYGFARISGKIDDTLSAAAWTQVNLQDPSGLTAIVLTFSYPKWNINASLMGAWGAPGSEAGLSQLLWRGDLEVSLFL